MGAGLYFAFIGACVLLAATPGPNMALFIANGASHGRRAALYTVAGSATGLSILVAITALGMTSVIAFMAEWFDVVRWLGALYLIWLGIARLRKLFASAETVLNDAMPATANAARCFRQGLVASLSNPKVLLFLSAFFPQFLDLSAPVAPQLALLSVSFVVTVTCFDAALATMIGSARAWFSAGRRRLTDGVSGILLICGGVWLAAARRPV